MEEKQWKKLVKKIKKAFGTIDKYNINSPCLVQFLIHKGGKETEVVVTHRNVSTKFDAIRALSISTRDMFHVDPTDENDVKYYCLDTDLSKNSPPICVSTKPINELIDTAHEYDISESYYCFPKVVLKLIADELLRDITFKFNDATGRYDVVFDLDETVGYRFTIPFVLNIPKLDNLFRIKVFPAVELKGIHADMIIHKYSGSDRSIVYEGEHLKEFLEENVGNFNIKLCYGDIDVILYHVDFIKINPTKLEIIRKSKVDNIVTILLSMESKDINIVLEYRYVEVSTDV